MKDWNYEPARDLGMTWRERMRSARREGGLMSAIASYCWSMTVRGYLKTYHRLEVRGHENLPAQPPFVMVANHCSHLDALTLGAAIPSRFSAQVFPIAAGDTFFETPVLAAFASVLMNALPLWRKNVGAHSLDALRERLCDGRSIFVLFPEGTRSRDGNPSKFKPGLGRLIGGTSVPIVPCYITGAHAALAPGRKFPRPAKIRVDIGKPLVFEGEFNNREGWTRIVEDVEKAVLGLQPAS
jgi:1-acyl-sn-glycerol-3-phosphate acyltransferase